MKKPNRIKNQKPVLEFKPWEFAEMIKKKYSGAFIIDNNNLVLHCIYYECTRLFRREIPFEGGVSIPNRQITEVFPHKSEIERLRYPNSN